MPSSDKGGLLSNLLTLLLLSSCMVSTAFAQEIARVSVGNSTGTALIGDAVFTGRLEDVSKYSSITILYDTDVVSAANGFMMQLCHDVDNCDRAKSLTVGLNNLGGVHTLAVVSKYFRIRYTNGSVTQGHFRLQTIFHPFKNKGLTSSATQTITDYNDVDLVRETSTHGLDVARGIMQGQSLRRIIGFHVVDDSEDAIWGQGGDFLGFLQSAQQLEVVSTDTTDDAGDNGCREVTVEYLDGSFNSQTTTVIPDGQTPVNLTPGLVFRINRSYCTSVGLCAESTPSTTCANEGIITITKDGGGAVVSHIPAGDGESMGAHFTVPNGSNAYLRSISLSAAGSANKEVNLRLWARRAVDDVSAPFTPKRKIWELRDFFGRDLYETFDYSISFPEMTDIWFSGIRTGSTSVEVSAQFELLLVPNDTLPSVPQ